MHFWISRFLVTVCLLALLGAATLRAEVPAAVLEAEADRVAVVERASAATVAVFSGNGQGGGSGVVISPDGYALTNFHVTRESGDWMKCGMADGNLYDAVIVGIDPTGDVGLIRLLGRSDFPAAEMTDSDRVQVGDWCFTIGNPFLLATDFRPSVAYGVISGVHRYQYPAGTLLEYTDCLQADAAINPGNSGGPMFDAQGRLIGINGRGSFEKRGRVNVGVGYAISINQIKNFLGHLKSGRICDHATLGARVVTSEDHRIIVDDVLEESDAYRRGLRYGDELVSFAGRPITSVNGFKNALGIFPKGWRVPLSYVHEGKRADIYVRLRGLHRTAELESLAQGAPEGDEKPDDHGQPPGPRDGRSPQPSPNGPAPKEKAPNDQAPKEPERKTPAPKGRRRGPLEHPAQKAAPMPEEVKKQFVTKPGFVNYYFNQLNCERVWKSLVARGNFESLPGRWLLEGELAQGGDFQLEVGDKHARVRLPGGELAIDLDGDLSAALDPPNSGGLLAALGLWRRLLTLGPGRAGDVLYAGTVPIPGRAGLFDVLELTRGGVECRFLFDPEDGRLVALEMFSDEDSDPCEIYFGDYREVQGHMLPHRVEVHYGDTVYHVFEGKQWKFETGEK